MSCLCLRVGIKLVVEQRKPKKQRHATSAGLAVARAWMDRMEQRPHMNIKGKNRLYAIIMHISLISSLRPVHVRVFPGLSCVALECASSVSPH